MAQTETSAAMMHTKAEEIELHPIHRERLA